MTEEKQTIETIPFWIPTPDDKSLVTTNKGDLSLTRVVTYDFMVANIELTQKESKPKVFTIDRVRFSGKWAELWFLEEGGYKEGETWHKSCKAYRLGAVIENANLEDHVDNHGFKGLRMVWLFDRYNWEPFCMAAGVGPRNQGDTNEAGN